LQRVLAAHRVETTLNWSSGRLCPLGRLQEAWVAYRHGLEAVVQGDVAQLLILAKQMRASAEERDPESVRRARAGAARRAAESSSALQFRRAEPPRLASDHHGQAPPIDSRAPRLIHLRIAPDVSHPPMGRESN